jgi:hypothetical protein
MVKIAMVELRRQKCHGPGFSGRNRIETRLLAARPFCPYFKNFRKGLSKFPEPPVPSGQPDTRPMSRRFRTAARQEMPKKKGESPQIRMGSLLSALRGWIPAAEIIPL